MQRLAPFLELRLTRALTASGGSETAGERADLIARRDNLLELAEDVA